MFTKLKLYVAIAVGFITAILLTYMKGRASGSESVLKDVAKTENDAIKEVAAKQVENIKVANDVQKETIASDDETVDKELSDKWTRK